MVQRFFFSPSFRCTAMDSKKRILTELNTKVTVTKSNKKEKLRWNKSWQNLTFDDWHSCESTFLSSALRHPKEHSVEGSQATIARPTSNNSIKMKSEQQWGNYTDRPGEKSVPTILPIANITRNGPGLKPGHFGEMPATNSLNHATFCIHLHFKVMYNFNLHLPQKTVCLITYLLTPWSRVLLEKLTGSAASQEVPRIFGTRRFITVLTSARHLSLSWANSIQSPQPPPTSWRSVLILSSHLCLGLPHDIYLNVQTFTINEFFTTLDS